MVQSFSLQKKPSEEGIDVDVKLTAAGEPKWNPDLTEDSSYVKARAGRRLQ